MRYDKYLGEIILDGSESNRDYLPIENMERILLELYNDAGSGKGKNSSVFLARDPNGEEEDYVVKFCNHYGEMKGEKHRLKRLRFNREIDALNEALKHHEDDFLLNIIDSNTAIIDGFTFKYYVMEKAEHDLSHYLSEESLSLPQKVCLCDALRKDLEALHKLGIYHRDLKPDNIFIVDGQWKIGDLGFLAYRDNDFDIDEKQERIGPTGLMSPEAMNKAFANIDNPEFDHDRVINHKSDIFQLGKLFWYIFQGNFPTGQIIIDDFRIKEVAIFKRIIFPLLQHAKARRPDLAKLNKNFEPIRKEFVV